MTTSPGKPARASKLTKIELSRLGRKPRNCPPEVKPSWARLEATHRAIAGLFDTLDVLRKVAAQESDPRGRLTEDQLDQVRAAIVFTSAGLDACLRRLLRDALPCLIEAGGKAHGNFTGHLYKGRLRGELTEATKRAIVDPDPRAKLIELYVKDLTDSSLQSWKDLKSVRDALGLTSQHLADEQLEDLDDFFTARNQISHELDLEDPSGRRGIRARRHRDMKAVGEQCDRVIRLVEIFLRETVKALKDAAE